MNKIKYNRVMKLIAENKKAYFNYFVEESLEAGISLQGTEVKVIRNGGFSFGDAFIEIVGGEAFIKGFNINTYEYSSVFNHIPQRVRKLLLHKDEIKRLERKVRERGYTLIPLAVYLKGGRVKLKIGLCKGKKLYDKRAVIKEKDIKKDMKRAVKNKLRGL